MYTKTVSFAFLVPLPPRRSAEFLLHTI
jgi:hypothetical protein